MKYRVTTYGWLDIVQAIAVFVIVSLVVDGGWAVFFCAASFFLMLSTGEHKAILRSRGVSDAMIEKKHK